MGRVWCTWRKKESFFMPNEKDETDGTRTVLGILSITRVNSHSSDSD